MLDRDAYAALWALFDAGGPRVEYVLPVLWEESGFNPQAINSIGCAGVNQACSGLLSSLWVDANTYASWSAGEQIRRGLTPYMLHYSPLRSATRVFQANFLPATLSSSTSLSSVLAHRGDAYYAANPSLDVDRNGTITVGDLAKVMAKSASSAQVRRAIASAYVLRPGESPKEPVYGEDFGMFSRPYVVAAAILVGTAAVAYGIHEGGFDRAWRALDRATLRWTRAFVDWM